MSLSSTDVWEVRTAGSDNSGGAFNSAAAGTDRSQADSAFVSGTNLTVDAVTNTDVTPDGHTPGAADVGNVIQITAGAGFTTGFYEILSIQSGKWRLDRSPAATGTSGGTWAMGGALASPGKAGSGMVAGNDLHCKSGTYTVTSASSNVAAGCMTLPAGASAANPTQMAGYQITRGDGGTKPVIKADGVITSFTLVSYGSNSRIEYVEVDGNSRTSSRGFAGTGSSSTLHRCIGRNCTNNAFNTTSNNPCNFCLATGCSTQAAFSGGRLYGCVASSNTVTGFSLSTSGFADKCIASNNTGASSDGFAIANALHAYYDCIAYGNGRDGFRLTAASTAYDFINCLAVNNGGYGWSGNAAAGNAFLYNCAGYNNTSGNVNTSVIAVAQQIGFITLTADPFTNAAGLDFSLNNTPGGGALLRAAGLPGATAATQLPGLSTLSYPDVGAAQHKDSGGGGASVDFIGMGIN